MHYAHVGVSAKIKSKDVSIHRIGLLKFYCLLWPHLTTAIFVKSKFTTRLATLLSQLPTYTPSNSQVILHCIYDTLLTHCNLQALQMEEPVNEYEDC